MTPDQLEARLRQIGAERYHNLHPFHKMLHGGELNKGQVQAWALNRYYYQCNIPIKDSALMARIADPRIRLEWRHRLEDHDGSEGVEGGIERWFKLTDGLGLDREYVRSTQGILPATRFAVDAYVTYVKERTPLEGMASSLTELFAPRIHKERIAGMLDHYDFVSDKTMAYFKKRLAGAAGSRVQRLDFQVQCSLGAARRPVPCLHRGAHSAGRVCARGFLMGGGPRRE
jgi:pyrroloquinoline-quinone synthase